MSRFPELFEEAIEGVVDDDAFLVEDLAEHVARHIVARQEALLAEVRITARYPYERRTPVSELSTQEMVSLIGIAAASRERVRRVVGVEATGINACPCAQGLVRGRAAERLLEAGFDERRRRADPRARPARDAQPARPRHAAASAPRARVNAERLVEIVEGSMSSPIYELLKRPDELFVVEHAHLQPRFVEDSVRVALEQRPRRAAAARRRRLRPLAPGQLRDDPRARGGRRALRHDRRAARGAGRRRPRPRRAHRAQGLAAARRSSGAKPRKRFSSPSGSRRMFARWRTSTAAPAQPPKAITGHG